MGDQLYVRGDREQTITVLTELKQRAHELLERLRNGTTEVPRSESLASTRGIQTQALAVLTVAIAGPDPHSVQLEKLLATDLPGDPRYVPPIVGGSDAVTITAVAQTETLLTSARETVARLDPYPGLPSVWARLLSAHGIAGFWAVVGAAVASCSGAAASIAGKVIDHVWP